MEDVQYHLNGLFRLIKKNLAHIPPEERKLIESAANATQRALTESKEDRKKYGVMVKDMRNMQRAYFKASREKNFILSTQHLQNSKRLEYEVDKKTDEIVQGVKQPDLFA